MPNVTLAPYYTQRTYTWTAWKAVELIKGWQYQYDDDGIFYTIWFYDGPEIHTCSIWKGILPDSIISGGYSQAQNDSDKSDFETNFKGSANSPISPKSSDGRSNFAPTVFPIGTLTCFTGAGDSGGTLGSGNKFQLSNQTNTDVYVEWQFKDYVYMVGGAVNYAGAQLGDWIDFYVHAPATTLDTGGATQSCNIAGGVMIIPVSSGGAHNVDTSIAIPVPNSTMTGHWDWMPAANNLGNGIIIPNYNGTGWHDLYTIDIKLSEFLVKVPLLGDGNIDLTVPAVIPKKIIPQWIMRATLHNNGHILSAVQIVWFITVARYKTT